MARPTGRERRAEARRRAEERRVEEQLHRRPSPRFVLALVAAAVLSVAGIAVGIIAAAGGPSGPATTAVQTLLHSTAADFVVAGRSGWVLDDVGGTIRKFDPVSGRWQGPARPAGTRPDAIAAGYGALWVADAVGNRVLAIDPRTGRQLGPPIPVGAEPVSIATGEGGVWVASLAANTLSLIDPTIRTVVAQASLPDGAVRVAVGDGAVWVTGLTDTLSRVSPVRSGSSLSSRPVQIGKIPIGIAVTPRAVWVADAQDGTVDRVDPASMQVTGIFKVTSDPIAIAVLAGRVWVGDGQSGVVTSLDEATGSPTGTAVHLAGPVRRLLVSDGRLLAATANPGTVVRLSPS